MSPPGRSNKKHLHEGWCTAERLFQGHYYSQGQNNFPTGQNSHLSHKCIPWLWRCHMLEAQYQLLPFYLPAVWNDESGLLRETKLHSCCPEEDSFPLQRKELLPAPTQKSQMVPAAKGSMFPQDARALLVTSWELPVHIPTAPGLYYSPKLLLHLNYHHSCTGPLKTKCSLCSVLSLWLTTHSWAPNLLFD